MEPFKVKCVDASFGANHLSEGQNYTVVKVHGSCYRLAETGSLQWSSDRFVQVDEEMDYWVARCRFEEVSKPNKQAWGEKRHLVIDGIHDQNTANNLVVALTKRFDKCRFEIESGQEYSVVENPPSISGTLRKRMKTFCEGFLAALP